VCDGRGFLAGGRYQVTPGGRLNQGKLSIVAIVMLSLGWAADAQAAPSPQPRYTIQYLPNVPNNYVRPIAVNDLGHIVGTIGHFGAASCVIAETYCYRVP
jgi:hypothetical protein